MRAVKARAAVAPARPSRTLGLNFVVTGQVRAGTGVVQGTVANHPLVVCHAELFHPDPAARRAAHEGYFGRDDGSPGGFVPGLTNPCQYLKDCVFDRPAAEETAIGVCALYPFVADWELYDFFSDCQRDGDFCLIHVLRNPITCLVSLKQARQSGRWRKPAASASDDICPPPPVYLDPAEVTAFARAQMACRLKVARACDDALEVHYRDLVLHFDRVAARLFEFLTVPPARPACAVARLRNRATADRISNFAELRLALPSDLREFLKPAELF